MSNKPYKGEISNWSKRPCLEGIGYYIIGHFINHPDFAGQNGHTSWVVTHNETTNEIETRNSRYRLVYPNLEDM